MSNQQAFEHKLATAWPPERWQENSVLVAVSGGADSIALLRGMHSLASFRTGRLAVAHFNHHLRGEASDADEQFVVRECRRLEIDCQVGHGTVEGTPGRDCSEAAARAARYEFLRQSAERLGARYVATAHSANDQAETVLHHILRGTGLTGLSGMPRTRPLGLAVTLIRPLLDFSRGEVLAYLSALGQPYREDSTNSEVQFTRNRIRHELLPLVERDYSPSVVEALLRLAVLAADAQRVIDRLALELYERSVRFEEPRRVTIDCDLLAAQDRHLVREMLVLAWRRQGWPLQSMGFVEWNLLADLALAPVSRLTVSKQIFPGAITAERRGNDLQLIAASAGIRSQSELSEA